MEPYDATSTSTIKNKVVETSGENKGHFMANEETSAVRLNASIVLHIEVATDK
jgi:hypothetical protein